jgi:hypothetical protein
MYFSALVGRKVPKERHPRQGTHGAFLGNPTTSSARPFAPAKGLIARTGRGLTVARGIGGTPITSVVTYSTRGWVVARRGDHWSPACSAGASPRPTLGGSVYPVSQSIKFFKSGVAKYEIMWYNMFNEQVRRHNIWHQNTRDYTYTTIIWTV